MKIDIVTRASRGIQWLDRCYETLLPLTLDWTWHILTTPDLFEEAKARKYMRSDVYMGPGHSSVHDALCGVNYYLDTSEDNGQWVFNLDDDNLMHPNFSKLAQFDGQCDVVLFSQHVNPSWRRIIDPDKLGPGLIDLAQFIAKRSAIGNLRFWQIYRGDSYFIQELVHRCRLNSQDSVAYCIDVMSYYNAQRYPFTNLP